MTASLPARTANEAPTRRPRLIVAGTGLAYALAYLLWLWIGGADAGTRGIVSEAVFLPINATLVAMFLLAARHEEGHAPIQRSLRYLAGASAMLVAGNLVTLDDVIRQGTVHAGSLADLFFLVSYPLTLAAYLAIPVGGYRMDRWKLFCDAGMVLSGFGVALWFFVLRPIAASSATPVEAAFALLYPLADLLLLVGITTIVLRRPLADHRGAIVWLGISTALGVVADLAFNLVLITSGSRSHPATDALYFATYLALLVSAELFLKAPSVPGLPRQQQHRARVASALPFVAAGATYLLLSAVALSAWHAPLSGLALGAVGVSVFLGARQLLAFRQTAARVAEAAVHASEARFRSLVQNSSDLIFVIGADGVIHFASSSASRLIGYESDALVGVELSALAHPADTEIVDSFVRVAASLPAMSPPAEWRLRGTDDTVVHVEAIASNRLADEAVGGVVVNARDVGERKALLDQLAHQAFHDPLTGLANRALFYDRVSHALELAQREGRTVTVLFLDLDDFKRINDTMGHAEGDHLLRMVANRLRASARATDTVARLGGDEFAVLVEDTAVARSTERLIERIAEQMAYPFTLAGGEVHISASVGSASTTGGKVDELVRHADVAMYAAKRDRKGSHQVFEQEMLRKV